MRTMLGEQQQPCTHTYKTQCSVCCDAPGIMSNYIVVYMTWHVEQLPAPHAIKLHHLCCIAVGHFDLTP